MDQFNSITATPERITPEMAKAYLATSKGNPRWSNKEKLAAEKLISRYANSIKNGSWELNGETIVFTKSGTLKDGHHRLAAIVRANMPADILVVRGVSDDVKTFDEGSSRPIVQVLRNEWGIDISTQLASALLVWVCMTEGEAAARAIDNADRRAMLEDAVWYDAESMCNRKYEGRRLLFTGGVICSVYAALKCGEDPERVRQFTDVALKGISTTAEDTAAIIAVKFINECAGTRRVSGWTGGPILSRYIQNCIYDFCRGTPKERRYKKPIAYYTDRYAKLYAREAERKK